MVAAVPFHSVYVVTVTNMKYPGSDIDLQGAGTIPMFKSTLNRQLWYWRKPRDGETYIQLKCSGKTFGGGTSSYDYELRMPFQSDIFVIQSRNCEGESQMDTRRKLLDDHLMIRKYFCGQYIYEVLSFCIPLPLINTLYQAQLHTSMFICS
jgi:hypothetical protein